MNPDKPNYWAWVLAALAAIVIPALLGITGDVTTVAVGLVGGVVVAIAVLKIVGTKTRKQARNRPFPAEWRGILNEWVRYYASLGDADKHRFEQEVSVFLASVRVSGVATEVDDVDRILVAASGIIPIFGFRDWEYPGLREVLLYPGPFKNPTGDEEGGNWASGMVGNGPLDGLVLLSKPHLRQGFKNPGDKANVGIHEFAHLVDMADGSVDGVPAKALEKSVYEPWLGLINDKMEAIIKRDSEIGEYGATASEEFFAVATEYFFERPHLLSDKHPKLYAQLVEVFRQSPVEVLSQSFKPRREIQRNDPCPCGSGEKYKKCCLPKRVN